MDENNKPQSDFDLDAALAEKFQQVQQDANRLRAMNAVSYTHLEHKKLLGELSAYYISDAWKRDFAADEAGLLPKDLKRGVLSEDGIYNLLEESSTD